MYQKDDYVVYGCSGVCKVMNVSKMDISGMDKDKLYYTLQPVNAQGSQIYTPIDNEKIVIRKVMNKEEADQLVAEIPETSILWIANDKQREEKFKEAIKSCDSKEWVRVIKTLYLRKQKRLEQGKKVTATDEKYFKLAEEHLYSELAIALKIEKGQVREYIEEKINHAEV